MLLDVLWIYIYMNGANVNSCAICDFVTSHTQEARQLSLRVLDILFVILLYVVDHLTLHFCIVGNINYLNC